MEKQEKVHRSGVERSSIQELIEEVREKSKGLTLLGAKCTIWNKGFERFLQNKLKSQTS